MRIRMESRPGVLLLEVILGIAVFLLFLGATGLVLLNGEESTKAAGDRVRGTEYARQTLEAARSIRETNFSSLTPGTHGIAINPATGRWELSGTQTVGTGGYVTTLTITTMSADRLFLVAKTSWQVAPNRAGSVTLSTVLTNWEQSVPVGKWSNMALSGSYVSAGTPLFNDIAVTGDYAYVTSETSGGGAGLYVFDISAPTSPTLANTVALGSAGYGIDVRGTTLYLLTSDANAELKAYSLTNPATPALVTSYDLPGSGNAKALTVDGDRLLVGATGLGPMSGLPRRWPHLIPRALATQACYDEFGQEISCSSSSSSSDSSSSAASSTPPPTGNDLFGFDISNPSVLAYKGSLYVNGANGISLSGTSAYLASPYDTAELQVVNVKNLTSMSFAAGSANGAAQGGYNLNDRTLDGLTTAAAQRYLLLGTDRGSIQELVLFDIANRSFPVGGPWYHEGSGAVVRVAMDPTACYGFLADNSRIKTLQIVKVRDYSLQELQTWDAPLPSNNGARGMLYDAARDRIYLVNQKGFYIFSPQRGVANDCP